MMPRLPFLLVSTLIACLAGATPAAAQQAIVSLAPSASTVPMTGRLFVIFARSADRDQSVSIMLVLALLVALGWPELNDASR